MEAIVCGIDPGLKITGYALIQSAARPEVVDAGVCRFDEKLPLADRLVALDHDIAAILTEHSPDTVAVEQLYAHYKHPRTAILMGHARGVILLAARRLGIEVRSYPSTQVKRYLTGNGRASKQQVQRAVQTTLGLTERPEPSDLADAIAIALCSAFDLAREVAVGAVR
jgi:crossover junction endodeoxyribonuclease RuvC